MPEILTESFCERCGTRYTFESATPRGPRLKGLKVMSRGLKNFVLSDDTSMDEAMAAARNETDREQTAQQLDAFHKTFNFCMSCRQYTCGNCWNEAEGRCLSCAPHLGHEVLPAPFSNIGGGGAITLTDNEAIGLHDRNGHDAPAPAPAEPMAWPEPDPMAWPTSDLMRDEGSSAEGPSSFVEAIDAAARLHAVSGPGEALPDVGQLETDAPEESEVGATVEAAPADIRPAHDEEPVDQAASAAANTTDLLQRFRPGQSIDDQLAAFEREQQATAAAERADAAEAAAEAAAAQARAEEAAAAAEAQARAKEAAAAQARAEEAAAAAAAQAQAERAAAAAESQARAEEAAAAAAAQARAEEAAAAAAAQARADEAAAAAAAQARVEEAAAAAAAQARADEAAAAAAAQARAEEAAAAAEAQARADEEAAAAAARERADEEAAAAMGEARDDLVFQPTWQIVAPEPPTSDGVPAPAPPTASPSAPPDTVAASAEPQWPAQPEWPRAPSAEGLPFLGRPAAATGGIEALWAESAREVANVVPATGAKAMGGVQPCVSCGLSLSANARFCRRCGTRQG